VSIVALGAVRSCGVTTLALALAATWPHDRHVLLVELDSAGGTLAAALGWPPEPSLVSLAAAARRGSDPELVWEHCHALPGGAPVLAGPATADQARTALGMLGGLLGRLDELVGDVLVDCGRLAGTAPSAIPVLPVLAVADRVVLVARPRLADLHALATWLDANPSVRESAQLVLVGDGPYPDVEVSEAIGVDVLARLPWDPDGAEGLVSVPATARELKVAPLVRAARTLANHLNDQAAAAGTSRVQATAPPGRATALRTRVQRAWRPGPAAHSTNGSGPEESSQ
jgi:Flp pilus assembly CpaE family ATPase